MQWVWHEKEILNLNEKLLLSQVDSRETNEDNKTKNKDTQEITITQDRSQDTRAEERDVTKKVSINEWVTGNVCPICRITLADKRTAIQHVQITQKRMLKKGEFKCVTKRMNKGHEYKQVIDNEYFCKQCHVTIKGKEEVLKHCQRHIEEVCTGTKPSIKKDTITEKKRDLFTGNTTMHEQSEKKRRCHDNKARSSSSSGQNILWKYINNKTITSD